MTWKKLVDWSKREFSFLPWRQDQNLYKILVSEIMLQQTTVPTVLGHFEKFLKLYPNVNTLAASTEEEVCMAWKGLGYYRRARNLRKAAICIRDKFQGEIVLELETLKSIDGVGDYTANALLAFGGNETVLAVDANLERVLSRYYLLESEKGIPLKKEIAAKLLEGDLQRAVNKNGGRDINGAIMDLGRVICKARKTDCNICPLTKGCQSFQQGNQFLYPRDSKKDKKEKPTELFLLRVFVKKKDQFLTYRKEKGEWLEGQLEVPTFIIKTSDKKLIQYPKLEKSLEQNLDVLKSYKTSITKYKITNFILPVNEKDFTKNFGKNKKYQFLSLDQKSENYSTATLKLLRNVNSL